MTEGEGADYGGWENLFMFCSNFTLRQSGAGA